MAITFFGGDSFMSAMSLDAFCAELEQGLTQLMESFRQLHQAAESEREVGLKTYFKDLFKLQSWFQEHRSKLVSEPAEGTREKQFELLYKSSLILDGAMEQSKLLNLALDTLLEICECDRGFIATIQKGDQLDFVAARNFQKEDIPQPEREISSSVVRRVRDLEREVQFDNSAEDDSLLYKSSLVQREGTALLCVPILVDMQVKGVIYLDHFKGSLQMGRVNLVRRFTTQLAAFMKSATQFSALRSEREELLARLRNNFTFDKIICKSKAMVRVLQTVSKVAPTEVAVLIQGETGTGKDLVAQAIHENSLRKQAPYVEVDCGALPDNLVESELFGHVRGSFTGAQSDRIGLLEAAQGGTLFLDEINNLPMTSQTKLLRALQQRKIRRLGETRERSVDFRLVTASSKSLEEMVKQEQFRQDLFYRMNTVTIDLPALRERGEDIGILADGFLRKHAELYSRPELHFEANVLTALENHSWPGNVRELEHVVERAVILCEDDRVRLRDLPFAFHGQNPWNEEDETESLEDFVNRSKKYFIVRKLQENDGNKAETARQLQVNRTYLFQLIKQLGI